MQINQFNQQIPMNQIKKYLTELRSYIHSKYPESPSEIIEKKVISGELEEKMNAVYKEFSDNFVLSMNA